MKSFAGVAFVLALGVSAAAQDPPAPVGPDALLTIPHILKTPVIHDYAISPDGTTVALSLSGIGKQTIWMMTNEDPVGAPIATSRGTGERDVDWSPDGKRIAFVASRAGFWHVYVSDPAGGSAQQLSRHRGQDRTPRFSPDGRHIAYASRREGGDTGWDVWVTTVPEGRARSLTEHPFDEEDPRWSPDGRRIALTYRAGRHLPRRIAVVTPASDNGELVDLLPDDWEGDAFGARWSPDGSELVFVSDQSGVKALYRVPSTRATPTLVVEAPYELTEPAWSPDGKHLSYLENRDGNLRLKVYELESQKERTLTLRAGVHRTPQWRPDGSAVLALYEAWNYPRDLWAYALEGGRERMSDTLPSDLDVRRLVRPESLTFESFDGREIGGFLYLPEGANPDDPAPLLVRPHGGPTSQWTNGWHPFAQLLVQHGYAVFAPNVRGSTGYGLEFENLNDGDWGRGDLEDLVAGTRTVSRRAEIQSDRIGIWGVSYGGFLTLAAITQHPDLFACAIEAVGMPDLEKLYRETNVEGTSYLDRELGPLRGNLSLYRTLSPIRNVDAVQTPLLSFHGEIYPLVPYETKRPFVDALRKRADYPLVELVFKREEARGAYRPDLHPEASWAYVEKILEFLSIYL